MKKLNVALIGQGRSGRDIHGRFFRGQSNTKYNVVAVVDAIPERREMAAKEYSCDVYADYRELFNRDDIDLVVNSTFSHMHVPIAIDLLEHGFNVICEKPFAPNYEEGARAVAVARRTGKMLNIFQQSRFASYFVALQQIIKEGKLGEPIQYSINFSGFARRWDWQTALDYGAGCVRNTGPHPLDQALCVLGFPKFDDLKILSKLRTVNSFGDAEDYGKIMITAPNKPVIDLEISSCNAYAPPLFVVSCQYGTLTATHTAIDYKYFNPETAPEQKLILESLRNPDHTPKYCSEQLEWTEEHLDVTGSVFAGAVTTYYDMIYDHLVNGKEMEINPEQVLLQLQVVDLIRAQNPLQPREP